jgi:beta-1,2-mannobiose phosphorylase / 1,2-beta-oligomannan phosphorylase
VIAGSSFFDIKRLGIVMRPDLDRPQEIEGVLNPGVARGRDGELYLFPRVVGRGNYSRIGICRVVFNDEGDPIGVERLGYALEPSEPYELRVAQGTGGCEDPRVTFIPGLDTYVMAYAAWGPSGPRLAVAVSDDCLSWERLGLITYAVEESGVDFNAYDNKDGAYGPQIFTRLNGTTCLGFMHRPMYTTAENAPPGVEKPLPSIWLSFCEAANVRRDIRAITHLHGHMLGLDPELPWEHLRIGGGTPPIRTHLGMMMIYHGVAGTLASAAGERNIVNYTAGVVFYEMGAGGGIRYRSNVPILIPETAEETTGVVNNVVFPTGVDDRGNGIIDIYYGMADRYIGAARMTLPQTLPALT